MEGSEAEAPAEQQAAPAEPAAATPTAPTSPAPAEPAQPAAQAPAGDPAGGSSQAPSTRGWTMFMDAPLPGKEQGQPQGQAQPPAEAAAPAPEPEAAPAGDGASDAKGWTVFMDRSPVAGQAPTGPMAGFAGGEKSAAQGPAASGEAGAAVPGDAAAEPEMARGKTVIASGIQAVAGPQGGVTGRAAPGEQPDTMYFKRGQTEPERVQNSGGADEVAVSSGAAAVEEGAAAPSVPAPMSPSGASPAVAPGRSAPVAYEEPSGGNKTVIIVVGVVVVIGIVAAAILAL